MQNRNYIVCPLRILTIAFLLNVACHSESPDRNDSIRSVFEFSEGQLLRNDATKPPKSMRDKSFSAYGKLSDTGVLNFFDEFYYQDPDGFQIRFYVQERKLQNPHHFIWVGVSGVYSRVNYGGDSKNEIEIQNIFHVPEYDKKLTWAKKYCRDWVNINKLNVDLNAFKKTNRFRKTLKELEALDFNKTEFIRDSSIVFFDIDNMICGINCGKQVLRENSQRGDFLTYLAICDIKREKLIRVKIVNTGYFLE